MGKNFNTVAKLIMTELGPVSTGIMLTVFDECSRAALFAKLVNNASHAQQ